MFFLVTRQDTLAIHPRDFGKNLHEKILTQLRQKVEGKASGHFGYTILVTKLKDIGSGILNEDTGNAHFKITYFSLVFRPFKGEILPGEVKSISKQGFFAQAGPLEIFVSKQLMPDEYQYETTTGAPTFLLPDDDDDNDNNDYEEQRLQVGTMVRIKIVGLRFAADDISVIGTIKEDYLGPFI
mmetsp:Transcript_12090/g.15107  ORF Transcript_12090/g.15107 Transcript_12090/m.15107 type:complete len:183 (-) Transcript_12090:156-704(-)